MASRSRRNPHARGYEYGSAIGQLFVACAIARELSAPAHPGIDVDAAEKLSHAARLLGQVIESVSARSRNERKRSRKAVRRG